MNPGEPLDIVAPAPPRLVTSRPLYCRVVDLVDAAPELRIVRLAILEGGSFRFLAGQYARVTFGSVRPRHYSMANAPTESQIEFHIKCSGSGGASAFVAQELRIGDGVWIEGPSGNAYFRTEHPGPSLLIAGGSGLAPMHSIAMHAATLGLQRRMTFYYGTRTADDLYYAERFRALEARHPNFRFVPVLTEASPCGSFRVGTVVDAVRDDVLDADGLKAYVAGPQGMVDAAVAVLRGRGMAESDIHADGFVVDREKRTTDDPNDG